MLLNSSFCHASIFFYDISCVCELMCEWRGLWEDIEETDIDLWLLVRSSGESGARGSLARSSASIGSLGSLGAQITMIYVEALGCDWQLPTGVASLTLMMGGDTSAGQARPGLSLFRPELPQCEPHPGLQRQTKRWSLHYNTGFYWPN